MSITIRKPAEIDSLRAASRIVGKTLNQSYLDLILAGRLMLKQRKIVFELYERLISL